MKLVILGGGGFRVPLVYEAVATNALGGALHIDEVMLYDISDTRLKTIQNIIAERIAELPDPVNAPKLRASTDLAVALRGADFIFAAIRVGGALARVHDERVALNLGLLGQETVGPGGLAYALRTIPVMKNIAEKIASLAPDAWTINFTNPAGIVTQVMRTVLGDRVVGICDTPIGLVRRVSRILNCSHFDYDYVGLNHLGWLRSVTVAGIDRLPELLADDEMLNQIEEARLIGIDWVRARGMLPNEYLYYYRHTSDAVAHLQEAKQTRGEFLVDQQASFYAAVSDPCCAHPLKTWRAVLREREATYMAEARDEQRREEDIAGGGYQEVALRLMNAIATNSREQMILNVGNGIGRQRVIPEFGQQVVIEVSCEVDAAGIRPRQIAPVSMNQFGLMSGVRAAEELIAEAALSGDRKLAWQGFALHPLVSSPQLGYELLEGYWPEDSD